jgi:DNA polymerase III delta prime subunit
MTDESGAGLAPYQGYEYQILATVWVALDLILHLRTCDHVLVEPASAEDIAAELRVDPEIASATLGIPTLIPLEVQIKLHRSGHWTESAIAKVLADDGVKKSKKGPARRSRALAELQKEPSKRYTLLTNAQLSSGVAPFLVNELGQESAASSPPGELQPADAAIAKRIGILAQKTEDVLRHEIQEILQRLAHVPYTKVRACTKDLEEVVRERLRGRLPREWTRADIESVIERYDGFPDRRMPSPLVPPKTYGDYRDQLAQGVLLLTGPPGSGKTHVAEHLAFEHRNQDDPFEVVELHAGDGVGAIRNALREPGRHLFFIHDPWGQFERSDHAQAWATELPKLVRQASLDKRFLVTSRVGIKEELIYGETNPLRKAERTLTEAHYTSAERGHLLDLAMEKGTPRQKDFAVKHREPILDRLRLPYSIDVFARALRAHPMEPEPDVDALIAASNVEVVGSTVRLEVEGMGRDMVASAVPLWAILMLGRGVSVEDASRLGRLVRDGKFTGPMDPAKLLARLSRAGWLTSRPDEERLIAHPTVLEGLELVVNAEPGLTEEVLTALLQGLVVTGRLESAKHITRQLRKRRTPIPRAAQDALNRHLLDQVKAAVGYVADRAFHDLVELSDAQDPVTDLARILAIPRKRYPVVGFLAWKPPTLAAAQVDAIRSSPDAKAAAAIFVRHVLPEQDFSSYGAQDLVGFFSQFGWDLSGDFLATLAESLERGSSVAGLIAAGALLGAAPPYDDVLALGLKSRDAAKKWLEGFRDEYRRSEQAELDAAAASYVADEPSERLFPSEEVLEVAVSLRRRKEGFAWIVSHPRREELLESWSKAIAANGTPEEIRSLLGACPEGGRGPAWRAFAKARAPELLPDLLAAAKSGPLHELSDVLTALARMVPAEEFVAKLEAESASWSVIRKLSVMHSIRQWDIGDDARSERLEIALLGNEARKAYRACRQVMDGPGAIKGKLESFGAPERSFLQEVARGEDAATAARAAVVLAELGEPVEALIPRLLGAEDEYVRRLGLYLAGSGGTASGRERIRQALTDPEYRCRRVAMGLLGPEANADERQMILARAEDPSAPVREECARLIGMYRWEEGQATLCRLLQDDRDRNEAVATVFRHATPDLHVARAAAESLGKFDKLSPACLEEIVRFVDGGGASCLDLTVHARLIDLLGYQGSSAVLPLLLNLVHDPRHMPGVRWEGFPLRFAAARGVVLKLLSYPEYRNRVKVESLLEGCRHDDGRLAGPCLIAYGVFGPRGHSHVYSILRQHADARTRAILLLVASAAADRSWPAPPVWEFVGSDHPVIALLSLDASLLTGESDWLEWLAKNPVVDQWLRDIQSPDGVHPSLRFALNLLLMQRPQHLLGYADLGQNDFAELVPVVTTRSLFGGE